MTDRPILFSAPMIRSLLAGSKTQTRRSLAMPEGPIDAIFQKDGVWWTGDALTGEKDGDIPIRIKIGDRLWVREAWRCEARYDDCSPTRLPRHAPIYYAADPNPRDSEPGCAGRLRASMHMPRRASRLTLTVTDVRVQRLNEISEDDAIAEGYPPPEQRAQSGVAEIRDAYPIAWYSGLWDSINGAGSWARNDWVVAYTFAVARRNIDAEG